MDCVMIYPGADEVGSVLFARVFNKINKFRPKVYIRYSSTLGPFIIPKYEDRPLNESLKSQVTSLGGTVVEGEKEADLLLAVHTPGKEVIEASEQRNIESTNRGFNNINEFLMYMEYFYESYDKPFAIADVAYANGSDNVLMIHANKLGLLEKSCAYGGWNTAQNTIGVVLAQASITAYCRSHADVLYNKSASDEFLLRKIIEDWLYQALVLNELSGLKKELEHIDLYKIDSNKEFIKKLIYDYLNRKIENEQRCIAAKNLPKCRIICRKMLPILT